MAVFSILLVLSMFPASSAEMNYDRLKTNTLAMLDNSINRIENAKNTISNNPKIDEATKTNTIANLTAMQEKLENYKTEVEATTTIVDLRNLNTEIIKYLVDNRDIIRNNVRMALINLGQKVADKADDFINDVEKLLKVMKVSCNEQTSQITEVEAQLNELQTSLTSLETAITEKDSATIKSQVRKISQLSKSIYEDMKSIEQAC